MFFFIRSSRKIVCAALIIISKHTQEVYGKYSFSDFIIRIGNLRAPLDAAETETTPKFVAKIVETETTYPTLDEAVAKAANGDTIEIGTDCETAGLNLYKDLTIKHSSIWQCRKQQTATNMKK